MEAVLHLIAAQYGSVSDIEVIWTVIATVGLAMSIYNVRDAWAKYNAVVGITNGRQLIAKLGIKMECTRIVIQAIFIAIGISAFFVPDADDQLHLPLRVLVLSTLFRWGIVTVAILVLYQSYANFVARRHLMEGVKHGDLPTL